MSDSSVWSLLREPDLLSRVLLQLGLQDLLSAELVCSTWREFILEQRIWPRRLEARRTARKSWDRALSLSGGAPYKHREAKKLFHVLTLRILPGIGEVGEQKQYEEARLADQTEIFQDIPQIRLDNPQNHFVMSRLMLFGPTAFPLLTGQDGSVVMAAAHYGRGRVVVLPHEQLLEHKQLMRGAAGWVAGSRGWEGAVSADPVSRAGRQWLYVNPWQFKTRPFPDMAFVRREQLLQYQEHHPQPQVFITEGHYDDHAEEVLAYVKNGGGLIVAGHAWFWASQRGRQECVLLNHPGNKITVPFGIAFSRAAVPRQVAEQTIQIDKKKTLLSLDPRLTLSLGARNATIPPPPSGHNLYSTVLKDNSADAKTVERMALPEDVELGTFKQQLESVDGLRDIIHLDMDGSTEK